MTDPPRRAPALAWRRHHARWPPLSALRRPRALCVPGARLSRSRDTATIPDPASVMLREGSRSSCTWRSRRRRANPDVLVLYASGDGGWFGAAVDMFRRSGTRGSTSSA